jgi:uncharacterized protein (TIGR03435 family)
MRCAVVLIVAISIGGCHASVATRADAREQRSDSVRIAFASASVKPAESQVPETQRGIRLQRGGVFAATAATLRELIEYAHQRHSLDGRRVTGGPAWIDSARFDILATAADEHWIDPDGAPRKTWAMLRTLLAERFKVRVEEETKDLPAYVLMVAASAERLGPRIQGTEVDCGALMRGQAQPSLGSQGPPCSSKTPPGRLFANTVTMPALASMLSLHLDRPVIDGTGLTGRFDFQLEASEIKAPPNYEPGPSDLALPPAAGPSIFVAVRDQLGLKLEPRIAGVSTIIVRHAELPGPLTP